jgi:acylphosphatase
MRRERHRVVFSGRVQGVGFRVTCRSIARGFPIAGYVRNLADGRVELVAEGDRDELDGFVKSIQVEMRPYIRDVATEVEIAAEPLFVDFVIRH